jgi:hypothetical protein
VHRLAAVAVQNGDGARARKRRENAASFAFVALRHGVRDALALGKRSQIRVGEARLAPHCHQTLAVLENVGARARRRNGARCREGGANRAPVEATERRSHRRQDLRARDSAAVAIKPSAESAHERLFTAAPLPEQDG